MTNFRRWGVAALLILASAFSGVAQTVKAEQSVQDAADCHTYANFAPVFQSDVVMLNPAVTAANQQNPAIQKNTPVNPLYALSETSALDLLLVMAEYRPVLFHSSPFGFAQGSGGWSSNRLVPWFIFPDGSAVNAGLLASYWTHGLLPATVKANVALDMAHTAAQATSGFDFSKIFNYPANGYPN